MKVKASIETVSENSVIVRFTQTEQTEKESQPSPEIIVALHESQEKLLSLYPAIIDDCICSYTSLLINYDFLRIDESSIKTLIQNVIKNQLVDKNNVKPDRVIDIPVYYGTDTALDIERVANHNHCSVEEVIHMHTCETFHVYAIGFVPGFAYLGFVPPRIATPRLASPRQQVKKGSVGIADSQTGIYPNDIPGGWNIIGQTPLDMLIFNDATNALENRLSPGDQIKFYSIDKAEFISLGGHAL